MSSRAAKLAALVAVTLVALSCIVIPVSDDSDAATYTDFDQSSMIKDAKATTDLLNANYYGTGLTQSMLENQFSEMFREYFDIYTSNIAVTNIKYSDGSRYSAGCSEKLNGLNYADSKFVRFKDGSMTFDYKINSSGRMFSESSSYNDDRFAIVKAFGADTEWTSGTVISVRASVSYEGYESTECEYKEVSSNQYYVDTEKVTDCTSASYVLEFTLNGKNVTLTRESTTGGTSTETIDTNGKSAKDLAVGDVVYYNTKIGDFKADSTDRIAVGDLGYTVPSLYDYEGYVKSMYPSHQYDKIASLTYFFDSSPPVKSTTGVFASDFQSSVTAATPGITVNKNTDDYESASGSVRDSILTNDKDNKTLIIAIIVVAAIIAVSGIAYMVVKKRNDADEAPAETSESDETAPAENDAPAAADNNGEDPGKQ